MKLDAAERDLIERIASSRRFGQMGYQLGRPIREDPLFAPLMKRLGLDFGRQAPPAGDASGG